MLASQLRRGSIDQAVVTAREARLRSVQYATRVRRVLETTRRDVRQVDWGEDVPALLDDGIGHLAERLDVERHLSVEPARSLDEAGDDAGHDKRVDNRRRRRAPGTTLERMRDRIDDLRTTLLEFRTSVSDELTATNRRIDELADEVRSRITTAEAAILNSIRDLGRDVDRRLTGVEHRLGGIEHRLGGVEGRLIDVEEGLGATGSRLQRIEDELRS